MLYFLPNDFNICGGQHVLLCIPILYLSDGKLNIVVLSFVHYLEVLEGSDRDKMLGITCYWFYVKSQSWNMNFPSHCFMLN